MQTVTEDDVVIVEPKRKRGRPKAKPPEPVAMVKVPKRIEIARMLVARGTPRKAIIAKCKLTNEEATALEAWNRGRR